jgi:hypothetical protein
MELMTEKQFFPAVSAWQIMPKLMGSSRKLGWISAEDIGFIVAKAFAEPDNFIGKELHLASDEKSIDESREIYREVMGKNPPVRCRCDVQQFGFVGKDLGTMWRWLRSGTIDMSTDTTLSIPGAECAGVVGETEQIVDSILTYHHHCSYPLFHYTLTCTSKL